MFIKSIEERLEGLLFLGLLFAGSCILLVSSFDILEKEEGRLFLFDEKAQDEEEKFVEKTLEDGQVSLEL